MQPYKTTPSPNIRRQSIMSQLNTPKTNPCLSPSLSTVSSFSNLRRPSRPRSTSISSTTSNNSTSSLTSVSTTSSTIKRRIFSPSSSISNAYLSKPHQRYTGTITVAIRIKPITEMIPQWTAITQDKISHPDHGDFKFDQVFGPQCDNLNIFHQVGADLVDKLFDGFNATLIAYGMTGSGKTYTMLGEGINNNINNNIGIVELCGSYIFDKTQIDLDNKYNITVSYLEIYNEKIHDLLDVVKKNEDLKLRSDPAQVGGGIHVVGLTEKRCQDCNELMKWVKMGELSRKTGKTDYNTRSSRSHAIIQIKLITTDSFTGNIRSNILSLCDLAGSERATAQLERRKEGAYINKSLLALGTVISKLSVESNGKDNGNVGSSSVMGHIPYRDSKLTRLLQPSLSGNSIVTTICTIDPRREASAETINTLRFGSRAKNISLSISRKSINTGLASGNGANTNELEKDRKIKELANLVKEQEHIIRDLTQEKIQGGGYVGQTLPHGLMLSRESTMLCENDFNDPNREFLDIENKLLKDKINNFEKLLDKDSRELQDTQVVEIVDMLPLEVGGLLETKVQGLESEIRQYKSYTDQLEKKLLKLQLKQAQPLPNQRDVSPMDSDGISPTAEFNLTDTKELEDIIQRKENKINDLQDMLYRKDKMIEALQSAKRLRDRSLNPRSSHSDTQLQTPTKL